MCLCVLPAPEDPMIAVTSPALQIPLRLFKTTLFISSF